MLGITLFRALAVTAFSVLAQDADPPSVGTQTTDCSLYVYSLFDAQREDGSWDATDVPEGNPGVHPGLQEDDLWVTSAITLGALGEGPKGWHKESVERSLKWIVSLQEEDGRLVSPGAETDLLVHALATLALTEYRFLMKEPVDGSSATLALSYLEARALESGGWNREGSAVGDVDPRTTAWACMAVASGRDGGLRGEEDRLTRAAAALTRYNRKREAPSTMDWACELIVRFLAGEATDYVAFQGASLRLLQQPVPPDPMREGHNPELVFLRTLVAYQSGGQVWKTWAKRIGTLLRQVRGHNRGMSHGLICDPKLVHGGSLGAAGFAWLYLDVYFSYSHVAGAR